MKILSALAVRLAALCSLLAVSTAQIAPIGPFTGANQEDFESITVGQFTCHPMRILQGTAMLCASNGGSVIVAGASNCSCTLQPQGNAQAFATNPGYTVIWFATPALRFGGYFALNCGISDGFARFWDVSGGLMATLPLTIPADCTYHWQGFQVTGNEPINLIEIFSNHPNGQLIHMDGLEADNLAAVETYCTAKANSLNCIPGLEVEGWPNSAVSWTIRAVRVRPGGIPGTLLYTVGGSRAAVPFQCGLLCIGPTGIRRAVPTLSSGTGQFCEGSYSIDMNGFAAGALGGNPSPALLVPGTTVHCQWWGRDSGFAPPCNTTLSNAVEYVIQ